MSENILMLQGPVGPFFHRVARDFHKHGHAVYKINFNGGDRFFWRHSNTFDFHGSPREWPEWLTEFIQTHQISRIYLFGDSRYYHRLARKVARQLEIDVYAFECGYIRPDCITLEPEGVNGNSPIPRDPRFYRSLKATPPRRDHTLNHDFFVAALWAVLYYLAATLNSWRFFNYRHHRPLNPLTEGGRWILSGFQKLRSTLRQARLQRSLYRENAKPYFFVPLQVHNDTQVRRHSDFRNIEQFITEVVASFAAHAPENSRLVLKHHPMDRPYRHYGKLVKALSREQGLGDRLVYLHDLHLPTLLHHAMGTVTINSTVGLSSIHHRTPTLALGDAIYNLAGLTHQGSLASFWHHPEQVDHELYTQFRAYLLRHNQLRGSLYQALPDASNPSGLDWPTALAQAHLTPHTSPPLVLVNSEPPTVHSAA